MTLLQAQRADALEPDQRGVPHVVLESLEFHHVIQGEGPIRADDTEMPAPGTAQAPGRRYQKRASRGSPRELRPAAAQGRPMLR